MAAPADYLDAKDLKDALSGGLIREDVLDEIYDISDIPTELLDRIGTDSHNNPYAEWTEDVLAAPDIANKRVSGSDNPGSNNAAVGTRKGNHAQISTKKVEITERMANTSAIGRSDEMGYQTARRAQELRRDQEAIILGRQASVADDNNTTPGQSAGLAAWLVTNDSHGTGGSASGFNTTTKVVATPTPGQARDLTWEMIATQIENCYILGAQPTLLMSVPQVTKRLARYLFTTSFAATPTANVSGSTAVSQVSQGYIDVIRTDFGFTMNIVPNRLQQTYSSGDDPVEPVADVFGIDPRYIKLSLLYGVKVEPLAKLGLSVRKLLSTDWMLKVLVEKAHFVVRDITPTATVTAGT